MSTSSPCRVGVLGGGQLGRMMALDARRMGIEVVTWTGGDTSGAASTADVVFEQSFDDDEVFATFLSSIDVATVEFENIPKDLLERVAESVPLRPGVQAIATCQHRKREKQFLSSNGFPCARFEVVNDGNSLIAAMATLKTDAILKTAEFGYDGKGQSVVPAGQNADQLMQHWADCGFSHAVLEEKIDLALEFSIVVARAVTGEVVSYAAIENEHHNHILDISISPARIDPELEQHAREVAMSIAAALDYIGVLAVEFFLDTEGRVLVNELAPRPHNSGHLTIDACHTSQFEQHIRAVAGLPLGSVEQPQPAVMWNLLGDLWQGPDTPPDWTPVLNTPGASLHLYGKKGARAGRKMGHVTHIGGLNEALRSANACRKKYDLPTAD